MSIRLAAICLFLLIATGSAPLWASTAIHVSEGNSTSLLLATGIAIVGTIFLRRHSPR